MKSNVIRKYGIQAAVCLLLLFSAAGGAVHHNSEVEVPSATIIQTSFFVDDIPYMDISMILPSVLFGKTMVNGQQFTTVELPNEGVTTTIGQAALPIIHRFLEIPAGATPELLVDSVVWETISLNQQGYFSAILPVQPSLVKLPGATVEFVIDEVYYTTNQFHPDTSIKISEGGEIRGRRLVDLTIAPVRYNPVSSELSVMRSCELQINLPGSDMQQTQATHERYHSSGFNPLYKSLLVNNDCFDFDEMPLRSEGYLIIVHDSFHAAILPFSSWKQSQGFDTTVTMTSQIPGGVTKENIKAYILDAYENWPTPPSYVLLVGDVAQIPTWTGSSSNTATDLGYSTLVGGDLFADVGLGRFPAANESQVAAMVDKTIFYEVGYFENESFLKKAVFMASLDNYQVSEGTHNYVITNYLVPNDYVCDKLYRYTYSATTQQVRDAFNDGRGIGIFSGHGSTTSWADGPQFTQSDVRGLTNIGLYPFVASHACVTGQFTVSECFAETWLRVPDKGAITFWSSSANTYWTEDDILEKRMFSAWWDDNLETVSGMTNRALYYFWQHYGGAGLSQYYLQAYNIMGDPSLVVWRESPGINTPPATPLMPEGPSEGEIGIEYTFTTSTTDPQNNQVYYMVSWGDIIDDWVGPYPSGETVSLTHTWSLPGDYSVRVKAKDTEDLESDWSAATSISILALPRIEIGEISGGFGLTAEIKNVGAGEALNIDWSISLDGGIVILGRDTSGTIPKVMPGFSPKVTTGFVFGFGPVIVIVHAGEIEKTVTATLLGPFFLKVQ